MLILLRGLPAGPDWPAARLTRALQAPTGLPVVNFEPEARRCPLCAGDLLVRKTRTRTLSTLAAGTFLARETSRQCRPCAAPPVGSRQLSSLAPPRQRFGYDLIVWAGLQRYHHLRQRAEVRADLARRGIELSDGSVSALCDRFLHLLEQLHLQRAPALRAAMPHGYPLHLDATCEKGKGGLFLCLDGWNGWVLYAVRIRSENADELRPAIQATLDAFGHPLAFMRDLGKAGAKAVAACRLPSSADLVCHFHFLAAVGRKLMDADHAALGRSLTHLKVRSGLRSLLGALRSKARPPEADERDKDLAALVLWLLEGDARKRPAYPFALAHLDCYRRCRDFERHASQRLSPTLQPRQRHTLEHVRELLEPVLQPCFGMPAIAVRLERSQAAFDALRAALRMRHDALRGRDWSQACPARRAARLASIAASVSEYRDNLREVVQAPLADPREVRPQAIVLQYLDRYFHQLFGHPVAFDASGQVVAVVERTNNPAEHCFSNAKRQLRRRLGRANLGRDMQDQPAQAALAANLLDERYVQALCGTLDQLPAAFASVGQTCLAQAMPVLDRHHRDSELRRRIRSWGSTP